MSPSVGVVGMHARPLAQSAARAGWDVVAVDAFGHVDLRRTVSRSLSLAHDLGGLLALDLLRMHTRLARAASEQPVDARVYAGGFENYPDLVAELGSVGEVLGNSPATLRAVRDPDQLREAVQASGMRMPQVLPPGARPDPSLRWLRKRRKSAGGFAIEPWTGEVPDDPDFLVQRWIEGEPGSLTFVADGHTAHAFALTRQLSGDPAFGALGFAYVGNLLIAQPGAALFARLEHLAAVVTSAFGLVGLNGIDFILHGEDVTVLEVNPRFSASMELVEEALGVSIFGWHVAGCRRLPIVDFPPRPDQRVFGKATVFARSDGVFPDTTDWPAQGWRDVLHPGDPMRAGLPMCTVIAEGTDEAECYARLVTQAQAVWNRL